MNFFKTIFFFFFGCVFISVSAQTDSSFQFIKKINGNFSNFNVDNLGNIYLLTSTNQLKKINEKGDSIAVFNNVKQYGNPTLIDVTNPLKILLYYQNFSTVVILDRLLNNRNSINFRKENIFLVKTIATSYDNNIWLFDEQDYKLKKIDEDGKQIQETTDWRILFDSVPSPARIIDQNNYVYLYDEEKGFYIFDYYGSLKNRLSFLNWKNIEVSEKVLYGFNNNTLYSYETNTHTLKKYKLPDFFSDYITIKAINGKVYILKNGGIDIYEVK